ncbi:Eukaryotic translation initiation factor 3 subunit H [Nowakowskiella sp. JEL0078]|nr:Eukaryotic translation initiation factor 3 subunit H [Nowakowskiella sp. JEL0078]
MATKPPMSAAAAVASGSQAIASKAKITPAASHSGESTKVNLEGLDPKLFKTLPIHRVEIDALVILKIIKHCKDTYPDVGNGQLLGLDVNGVLNVTNCFPFTNSSKSSTDNHDYDTLQQQQQQQNDDETFGAEYQFQFLKNLRRLGYDANTVGWYQSTYLGSYWNQQLIETQYNYQKTFPSAVHLVYDPTRTTHGNLCVKAMKLTDKFMAMYEKKKFSLESLIKNKMTPSAIFENVEVVVVNSKLVGAAMYELEEASLYSNSAVNAAFGRDSALSTFSTARVSSRVSKFHPNNENLELELESYLEKHLEFLGDTVEEHGQEQWRWQGWQRNVAKEQQKLKQALSKKQNDGGGYGNDEAVENLTSNLQKLIAAEPSRLETLIITNQVDTYAKQINQFAGPALSKMFMTKSLQPEQAIL